MSKLQFRLAARTDAAGKYNPTAPLEGNEDNMFVDSDLSNVVQGEFTSDAVVNLSEKGCLMVVADGMGGMNAGEVASAIAIKTVTEYFDNEHLKGKTFRDSRSRMNYMEDVVVAADAAIKADARMNIDHEGMGSTIIMAWLCDDEICLTWCGDSRAYLFRPGRGFWQVSKDHSYVQGLVDEGKITMDEAFDHPNGNIITRSLGDPEKKAKPDSVNFDVYQGDIFMLCSDGLSGVLRDHKTYVDGRRIETENLEDIIAAHRASMAECRDELFAAAERNDWYDNVTAILCEVVSGNAAPSVATAGEPAQAQHGEQACYTPAPNPVQPNNMHHSHITIKKKTVPILIATAVLLLGIVVFLVWMLTRGDIKPDNDKDYFDYCQKNPTIENYRSYVKNYPQGEFIDLANNWIDKWEKESINQAAPASQQQQQTEVIDKNGNTMKGKKEEKKEGKKEQSEKTANAPTSEAQPAAPKDDISNGLGILNKPKEDELNKNLAPPNSNIKPAEEGTNGNESGLKEVTGRTGLQVTGNTPEEKLYNEILTKSSNENLSIEDCMKYLRKWYKTGNGANAKHWEFVAGKFKVLYQNEIKKSRNDKDIQKLNDIITKHDKLMDELHLKGMKEYDHDNYVLAQAYKKELENAPRPQPGTQNAPSGR